MSEPVREVLTAIHMERIAQDEKWGEQNHPDFMEDSESYRLAYKEDADTWKRINESRVRRAAWLSRPEGENCAWDGILLEEAYEALSAESDEELEKELIQVAAVAVAWIQAIRRRKAKGE